MFFRAVIDKLSQRLQNDYKVDDLKDELFDMAKPSLPHCIQLEDLVKCGVGDIIIKILIDAKGFYDYDQRETGGITEEEFDEMNIGGYAVMPSPPPLEIQILQGLTQVLLKQRLLLKLLIKAFLDLPLQIQAQKRN
jgi:hypothetical protein